MAFGVTLQIPANGTVGVPKNAAVTFTLEIEDALTDVTVCVRTEQVYDGATNKFADGWSNSSIKLIAGAGGDDEEAVPTAYAFVVVPDRFNYWRALETVDVNVDEGVANASWSFAGADKPFRFGIGQFMLGAIRNKDNSDAG